MTVLTTVRFTHNNDTLELTLKEEIKFKETIVIEDIEYSVIGSTQRNGSPYIVCHNEELFTNQLALEL